VKLVPGLHNYLHILPARQLQHPNLLLLGNELQHIDQLLFPHEFEPTEYYCLLQAVTKLSQCGMLKSDFNRQFIGMSENKTCIDSNSRQNDPSVTGIFVIFFLWLMACCLWPVAPSI
jgi:hypothetical protein